MVVFIVLGALLAIGSSVVETSLSYTVGAANAAYRVQTDVNPVTSAINNYSTNAKACHGALSCVTRLDRQVAGTLNTFAGQLPGIAMPSAQASSADAALAASVRHAASIFARLGAATSASQYVSIANSSGLERSVDQINQDFTNLGNTLNS